MRNGRAENLIEDALRYAREEGQPWQADYQIHHIVEEQNGITLEDGVFVPHLQRLEQKHPAIKVGWFCLQPGRSQLQYDSWSGPFRPEAAIKMADDPMHVLKKYEICNEVDIDDFLWRFRRGSRRLIIPGLPRPSAAF